jgi:hypothetical protein
VRESDGAGRSAAEPGRALSNSTNAAGAAKGMTGRRVSEPSS